MDLDTLLHRASIAGAGVTVLLRVQDSSRLGEIQGRLVPLLGGRSSVEVLYLLDHQPVASLPVRQKGIRFRWTIVPDVLSGSALAGAFMLCRQPVIVLADSEARLTRGDFDRLLQSLELVDLVVGRRAGSFSWLRWPIERILRGVFGVPVLDPLCPVKAVRRSAVAGIDLQTAGPVVDFELVAKMTFLTSLMDECPITLDGPIRSLAAVWLDHADQLGRLFLSPRFWGFDEVRRNFRPPLDSPIAIAPVPHPSQPADYAGPIRLRPPADRFPIPYLPRQLDPRSASPTKPTTSSPLVGAFSE